MVREKQAHWLESQCAFILHIRHTTIEQICWLHQVLEKTHENQHHTHHILVDNKATFDSPIMDSELPIMFGLDIPAKLIRLRSSSIKVREKPFWIYWYHVKFQTRRRLSLTSSRRIFCFIPEYIAIVLCSRKVSSRLCVNVHIDIEMIGNLNLGC